MSLKNAAKQLIKEWENTGRIRPDSIGRLKQALSAKEKPHLLFFSYKGCDVFHKWDRRGFVFQHHYILKRKGRRKGFGFDVRSLLRVVKLRDGELIKGHKDIIKRAINQGVFTGLG